MNAFIWIMIWFTSTKKGFSLQLSLILVDTCLFSVFTSWRHSQVLPSTLHQILANERWSYLYISFQFFFLFFLFEFYCPWRLFHSFWAESIARCGENRRSSRKTTTSRTWLISHVTQARLKPTSVRWQAIQSAKDYRPSPLGHRGPPFQKLNTCIFDTVWHDVVHVIHKCMIMTFFMQECDKWYNVNEQMKQGERMHCRCFHGTQSIYVCACSRQNYQTFFGQALSVSGI